MPMAEELARGALPLAVLLDEDLERAQELVAVLAAAVLERAEHAVAEETQGIVVLKGEEQLERAQVAVGRDVAGAVAVRLAEGDRLQGAARLVEAAPKRGRRRDPACGRAWIAVPFHEGLASLGGELQRLEVVRVDHRAQKALARSDQGAVA